MNNLLAKFGKEPQSSKSKAKEELRSVNINKLFDPVHGRLDKVFPSVAELRRYTLENHLVFRKNEAKGNAELRLVFAAAFSLDATLLLQQSCVSCE